MNGLPLKTPNRRDHQPRSPGGRSGGRWFCAGTAALMIISGISSASSARAEIAATPEQDADTAHRFPVSLTELSPRAAEYGTRPDPDNIQTNVGPGKIDATPVRDNNNATWFWPNAQKIVNHLPAEDFKFPAGGSYSSSMVDVFASGGKFVTGVGLWGRTRNMYHWVEYAIPEGATRFTADVLVSDDPFGWMAGRKDKINQQFEFHVAVDDQEVARQDATLTEQVSGRGQRLTKVDIPLTADARVIRFRLEITPWGDGNKNVELIITEGTFQSGQ